MHCTERRRNVHAGLGCSFSGLIAAVVLACGLPAPSVVSAQAPHATGGRRETPRNVISIAPVGLLLAGMFAPEYERSITPSNSLVAALGYMSGDFDDDTLDDAPVNARYLRAEAKYRYYPDGYRLSQLLLGASVGITSASGTRSDDRGRTRDYSAIGPSAGLEVGYSGPYGTTRRPYWAVICGWKRVFWSHPPPVDLLTEYPTLRLAVGYAF